MVGARSLPDFRRLQEEAERDGPSTDRGVSKAAARCNQELLKQGGQTKRRG